MDTSDVYSTADRALQPTFFDPTQWPFTTPLVRHSDLSTWLPATLSTVHFSVDVTMDDDLKQWKDMFDSDVPMNAGHADDKRRRGQRGAESSALREVSHLRCFMMCS